MSRDSESYGIPPPGFRIAENTRVGRVSLQVSDLERSLRYYQDVIGLAPLDQGQAHVRLGVKDTTTPLVEIHEERGTRPVQRGGILGLYHFAILLPSRIALGQFIRHLAQKHLQFGAADHLVSEAIYLWDPDGLGIEIYADRPRHAWQVEGRELAMTTDRLDLHALVEAAIGSGDWTGLPAGTTMGHVHLSVSSLEEADSFFHRGLGLDKTVWTYPGALFMSAGGYHHHLGTNTWAMGARRATTSDARLREWELLLPSAADAAATEKQLLASGYDARDGVTTDPWGTMLRLTVAS